jgi:hypothetical protein
MTRAPAKDRAAKLARRPAVQWGPMNTAWRRAGQDEKILILDRGNVELAYPRDWLVTPDPEGFMIVKDPPDSARLEVSYLRLPPLPADAPSVEERLRYALEREPTAAGHGPVVTFERDGAQFAWTEYRYDADDTDRAERRPARGRWLVGANHWFQVFMPFYYWADDAAWAVAAWERIAQTLRLGDGVPLETPKDHWSLRGRR